MKKLLVLLGLAFTLNLNAQTVIEDIWSGTISEFTALVNNSSNSGGIIFENGVLISGTGAGEINNACIYFESAFVSFNPITFIVINSHLWFQGEENSANGVVNITLVNQGSGILFDQNTTPPCMGTLPVTIVNFSWNEYTDNIEIVVTDESNIAKYKVVVLDENNLELNSFDFVGAYETPADKLRVYSIKTDISCEGLYYVELWKLEKNESDFTIVETLSFIKN